MRISHLICSFGYIGILAGCVTPEPSSPPAQPQAMFMLPGQFYSEFPAETQSQYLTGVATDAAIENGVCVRLDLRDYDAPMGASLYEDLLFGAEGVDAIVANDGGNAYRITDFEWRPRQYGTQLHIVFSTLLCDFTQ